MRELSRRISPQRGCWGFSSVTACTCEPVLALQFNIRKHNDRSTVITYRYKPMEITWYWLQIRPKCLFCIWDAICLFLMSIRHQHNSREGNTEEKWVLKAYTSFGMAGLVAWACIFIASLWRLDLANTLWCSVWWACVTLQVEELLVGQQLWRSRVIYKEVNKLMH